MLHRRNWFIETLPEVIELVALGKAKGELQIARKIALNVVQTKYPALKDLAQNYVSTESDADKLSQLISEIGLATNEQAARQILQGASC